MHASSGCRGPDATIDRLLGWRGYGGCNHRFALNCSWQCPGFKDISFYWLHPFLSINILRFKEICFFCVCLFLRVWLLGLPGGLTTLPTPFPWNNPMILCNWTKSLAAWWVVKMWVEGEKRKKKHPTVACAHIHTRAQRTVPLQAWFFFSPTPTGSENKINSLVVTPSVGAAFRPLLGWTTLAR